MEAADVWERGRQFASRCLADQQPVFTNKEGVRNFITDVKQRSIGRQSDDGITNRSRVTRGEVEKLWAELNGGPSANVLYFTRAMVAAALPDLIEVADGRMMLRASNTSTPLANRYVARLCWNSKNWTRPTGEAAKSEADETYNASMGFGHEEWLFNYQWVLDGWKYGFLQPVNHSLSKVVGQTLEVKLYSIAPDRRWFYVGHIDRCEVLTEALADQARAEFKRRGWLRDMEQQVEHVGGDVDGLRHGRATLLFNVRFRPVDGIRYDPMILVGEADSIRKLKRYALTSVNGARIKIEQEWPSREGTTLLRPTGKRRRAAQAAGEIDLVHNQLQNELFQLLVSKHGESCVTMEDDFIDIKVSRTDGATLVEVKSESIAASAIRQALGQLLEYAYRCMCNGERVHELIIAAPGEVGPHDLEYLDHLRRERGLPLRYVCFRRGTSNLDI